MIDPFCARMHQLYEAEHLPLHDDLLKISERTADVLHHEDECYRPFDRLGKPGALLDFMQLPDLPLVVVPDLHARVYFLLNILDYVPPHDFLPDVAAGSTLLEALEQGAVRIVCVGDVLHAESRAYERWLRSFEEYAADNYAGPAMTEEMEEGLTLLTMVMECKCRFPGQFHLLKGNHENILNRIGGGDFSFRKFTEEGAQVTAFMNTVYGLDVPAAIAAVEDALPLAAVFPSCAVSHAEPGRPFTRSDLINARYAEEAVNSLIWTENDAAEQGSVAETLGALLGTNGAEHAVWFAGHRPVQGAYALRQNGLLVQIHNPDAQNIALVTPGRKFEPERDIVSVVTD